MKQNIVTLSSLHEMHLQGIMAVVFIKTNIESEMMNTTTACRFFSQRQLAIVLELKHLLSF